MSSPSPGKKRMDTDFVKLIENNYEVQILGGIHEFVVKFEGPKDSHYENGIWKVRVDLPEKYPFKSPSIGFMNRIFHPNIDEMSGTVCLDVINQAWTALYDLRNIFDTFLPQLLTYPNPVDPLNGDAAALYLHKPQQYKEKVREYVDKYASPEYVDRMEVTSGGQVSHHVEDNDDESSMSSDYSEDECNGMEL
ncbi:ubiquitin-conjugating enzyme E2 H-like [Bolinopsis microptera]|uniref:ubiquitin-conjugating enzyme E2 H-like n=1 Tax=Bolinopsis microptera TaxID=2820187 RepID=UPI0030794C6D